MKLTNNQKKHLRKLAHNLRPIVIVGQQGLSYAVLGELESTMTKHELLKIKVRANNREEKQKIVDYRRNLQIRVKRLIYMMIPPIRIQNIEEGFEADCKAVCEFEKKFPDKHYNQGHNT